MRDEIGTQMPFALHKTFVVPEAPREIFRPLAFEQTAEARKRLGVRDDFLLFVSTIEPRKNLGMLLAAYEELLRQMTSCPQLVVTGRRGWLTEKLLSRLQASNLKERVRLTGYISDDDLCALYASCRSFIYPSSYEGFGLPPLEAMACGAPVIASRIPALIETLEGAAELVPPTDALALASSIIALLEDEAKRKSLSDAGRKRAAEFTWRRAAELTFRVYEEVLGKLKREQRS
ncbi:MAG: glycosyltransferase family 4 protein [Pyrinomonadaceae bacterium]|nr:glycosyltransferase family 4 protein [Pyrinomonadaceae bacterium]